MGLRVLPRCGRSAVRAQAASPSSSLLFLFAQPAPQLCPLASQNPQVRITAPCPVSRLLHCGGDGEQVRCAWKSRGIPLKRALTGKDLMDHTISLFSGTHLTLPTVVLNLGESASLGTGMWISTLLAVDRRLNWLLAWR